MFSNCGVGEDSWESLGLQGVKPVNPKYSLEGLMLRLKLQYFGHLMLRAGKDPDAGKDWRLEKKGTTEDKKVQWYHQSSGHESEQVLGDGEEQGSLVYLQSVGLQGTGHSWATEQQQS